MPFPSVYNIAKFAFAAGALLQPASALPSSSVRPSATKSHSAHSSSRATHSLKPTSTAAPLNGTSNIPQESACAEIANTQIAFAVTAGILLGIAEVDVDPSDSEVLESFAEEIPLPADLIYNCLKSVPLNKTAATEFIKFVKPYLEFQSTLGWLKTPPPSYQQPAIDIMGAFDKITSDVASGTIKGQYDFEIAVNNIVRGSHDGHFNIYLPLLKVFRFKAPYTFVSVSKDGAQLPEIYVSGDLGSQNSTKKAPSAVKTINGKPAADYMTQFAKDHTAGYIDPQTDWNDLFLNAASAASGASSKFEAVAVYPGSSNLTLTFANGTTVSEEWFVGVDVDFTEIETGQDVYNKFVAPQKKAPEAPSEPEKKPSKPEWGAPYPAPVVVQKKLGAGGYFTGYFLNKTSTAVLSLNSFSFEEEEHAISFIKAVEEFLAKSKSAGMKKLVIDLQSNGGGLVAAGFELFTQLFPTLTYFGGNQFRVPKSVDLIGSSIGSANASVQAEFNNATNPASGVSDPYWYGGKLDVNNKPFPNWAILAGQGTQNGDRISNTFRQNFTNNNEVAVSLGAKSPRAPQVFAPKDVLLLTNGACSSTCTIFAEEMHTAGVKVVVAGGPPVPGPMQGVSGVRGSRVQTFESIDVQVTISRALNPSIPADALPSNKSIPYNVDYEKGFSLNLLNQVRQSKQDVPLHFIYQAADCRIFYTEKMLADYTYLWQYAADALWTNPGLCVKDSTGHPSAAPNVTTTTAISKTNGTSTTSYITTNGAGSSNAGLNTALLAGAIVSFVALLL